jgi:hypothetical protein
MSGTEVLYASYKEFADERRERHPLDRGAFGKFMVEMKAKPTRPSNAVVGEHIAPPKPARPQREVVGEHIPIVSREPALIRQAKAKCCRLGSLDIARAGFIAATNLPINWADAA